MFRLLAEFDWPVSPTQKKPRFGVIQSVASVHFSRLESGSDRALTGGGVINYLATS